MKLTKNKFRLGILGVVLLAIAVFVYFYIISGPFLYAGTLEVTNVDLSARLPAAISDVVVQEGDRIKEGEILIKFSCEDFKIKAKLARIEYERYLKLVKTDAVSPDTFDQFKTQMEDADTNVNWCTIASPIDGKVLTRYHEPGEWMEPGTKILTLANIKDIWAYIYVPEPLIAKLSLGMKLKAILPELNNRVFEGTIIKINDEAEFTPKNVQTQTERERLIYGVKVSFLASNAEEILKPGMTVEIELPK